MMNKLIDFRSCPLFHPDKKNFVLSIAISGCSCSYSHEINNQRRVNIGQKSI